MVIHCAQISAFVDYCSFSEHLQHQGLCLGNASQRCCAGGLGRTASSIGAVRSQGGSAHAKIPARPRRAFRPPFHRVCPSGKSNGNLGQSCRSENWPNGMGNQKKERPRATLISLRSTSPRLRQDARDLVLTGLIDPSPPSRSRRTPWTAEQCLFIHIIN